MISKTGSTLAKIASIIYFVLAVLILIAGFVFLIINPFEAPITMGIILIIVAIVGFIVGFLYRMSSRMMLNNKQVRTGAIISLVLGVLSLGNLIGVLGVIGGIIGLIDAGK